MDSLLAAHGRTARAPLEVGMVAELSPR